MDYLLAGLFAAAIWWFGTGILLLLNRSKESNHDLYVAACFGVAGAALGAIDVAAELKGVGSVYLAFMGAVCIWACLELPHLMGRLTGPVRDACPDDASNWQRFRLGIGVGLYHDLAILLVAAILWVQAYLTGLWIAAGAFTVLWLMRWSAKLNLFLGVANFSDEFVPDRFAYFSSYMRKRSMNALFPVSVVLSLGFLIWAVASAASASSFEERIGTTLVGVLAGLGLLEHVFMMVPIKDSALWRWFYQERGGQRA